MWWFCRVLFTGGWLISIEIGGRFLANSSLELFSSTRACCLCFASILRSSPLLLRCFASGCTKLLFTVLATRSETFTRSGTCFLRSLGLADGEELVEFGTYFC